MAFDLATAKPVKIGPTADAQGTFDTQLSPQEETNFQSWKSTYAPKDSGADYDLRGAFKEGLKPDPKTGHWPDTYKKPNHPTFSDQSKYAKDAPDKAGHWEGDKYISPESKAKKKGFDLSTARFVKPTFSEAASDAASDVWSETKKAGGELAAIADLPASIPSMLAKGVGFTGGVVGTGAAALKAGKPVTRKELLEEGTRTGEEFASPLANPVQRLMRYFGHEDDYTQSDVQNALGVFSGWLKKGNKWIKDKTGGVVQEEDADQIENALMAGGPVEAAKSVMKLRPKGAKGEPVKPGRVEPGPLPPEPGEFTEAQRSRLNELERASSTKPRYTLGPDGKPVKMASGRILTNEEKTELQKLRIAKAGRVPSKVPEADDFIKRMDKESEELSKGVKDEKPAKPDEPKGEFVGPPYRPFVDEKKWGTPLLERIATAGEERAKEAKARFEETKATERRRGKKTWESEEHGDAARRSEDRLKLVKDELNWRKAAMGAAGVAAGAYVAGQEDLEKKLGMSPMAAAIFIGMPEGSIGSLLRASKYGSRVIERLAERDPAKSAYKKAELVAELNRQDVPAAEKKVIQDALAGPGETISAKQLMQQFKLATQDFELKSMQTEKFNDFGIDRIRPPESFTEDTPARSTVWKLPDKWNIPASGHFTEMGPNQYGHTRSFDEGGARHVVELQSDLLQHTKSLSDIDRKLNEKDLKDWEDTRRDEQKTLDSLNKEWQAINAGDPKEHFIVTKLKNARANVATAQRKIAEINARLAGSAVDDLSPIAKAWPRRLIQEEIAQASREGIDKIRFASADTVAKVEGWPRKPLRDTKGQMTPDEAGGVVRQKAGPFESASHQSIHDRYADEITKYLKSLGATPYTDPHGHTWWEVKPKRDMPPRQFGKADPKLLAGAAAGIIAGSAVAGDDHRVSGALAGAMGGALLVGAFGARMFSKAEGGVPARELSSALDKLVGKQKAKQLELLRFSASVPKDYSQHAEQIYHSLEDPTIKLSPRAQELKTKYVEPIMRQNALLRADLKKKGVDVGEDVDAYVHRIPKGKPSIFEQLEQTSPQGKTLSQFAPPLEERTVFKLTDPETGETLYGVKNETGQGYKVYRDKEIVGSGKISPKLWKEGNVPFGGRTLKRSQATTKELETHTPLEYHHDALASAISSNARLARIRNNNMFLENFLKSPETLEIALKTNAPKGWREVPQIPQLRGYKFAPRVANVLEDFAGRQGSDLAENIGNVSRILTGSLFWNPLPHIFNVLDHSIVQRGLVSGWLNPAAYPRLVRTTIRASKAVTEQSEEYLRFVKEGAGLMYPNVLLHDFSGKVLEQLGQRPEMGVVAQAWGYANPAEMVRRIYAFSRKNLWAANDILMMQAYLEKEMIKPEAAIAEVEKHIPNYRVPNVVLGSRMVSQALQSPIVTAFGRYDYGRMKSYGEMVKGLVAKDRGLKDRAKALDQIAMLTVMGVVVYPLLMDNMAKTITGNPNAEATRFGASGIPYLVYSYIHGRKQFSQVVGSAYPPGMAAKATAEIVSNRDLFTGKHLFESSSDIAPYLAKQLSPIGTASRIESGQQTFGQFAASAVGIRSPQTPEQKRALTAKRRREQTRKRIDAILNH